MRTRFTILLLYCLAAAVQDSSAQATVTNQHLLPVKRLPALKNIFSQDVFIRNMGQYGQLYSRLPGMGHIRYGFEGFKMPVLFTEKGVVYLHRKVKKYSREQERMFEKKGVKEDVIEKGMAQDASVAAVFLNANKKVRIIADSIADAYFTYGFLKEKAYGFKRITYKELYPHIDLLFHFNSSTAAGFEYSFIIKPGGNVNDIQIKYTGDVKKITSLAGGNLLISSGSGAIRENRPVSFTTGNGCDTILVTSSFKREKNIIGFFVGDYDKSKTLCIDPFVSSTGTLTGTNRGIAKDIDFDYDGNIYVAGGGDGITSHKLAKYNAAGILQWTFSGSLTTPSWSFGASYGGWVVEKQTGNIFLGQGMIIPNGSRIIRLNTAGLYDNYITDASNNFSENWKMIWSCNNGQPQILVGGGTTTSSNSIGICTPPNTAVDSRNLTGSASFYQDIADMFIDPVNNDMYTLFSTGIASLNNRIYKHHFPYNASTVAWNTVSGYSVMNEIGNRPYLSSNPFGNNENSANILAANSRYLFYWDGKHLKAFDKLNGAVSGTPLTFGNNTPLMQGGIIADECDNVFIGNGDDTIKVFKFNGNTFDDAAAPDITVPGFPGTIIYDLAYDQSRQLLYACGSGLVASFDISGYCASTTFVLTVNPDCHAQTAQAVIAPAPPAGTAVTYVLLSGNTQVQSNTTGFFTGLTPGSSYTVKAFLNQSCGGLQLIKNFLLDNCIFSVSVTSKGPACTGVANGSITATAVNGTPPYLYSLDGINFQNSGFFNNLATGSYTVTVKDFAGNIITSSPILLDNTGVLQLSVNSMNLSCGLTNGTITATAGGGTAPFQYSVDGINYQATPVFTGLPANNYTVYVKDISQCIAAAPAVIGVTVPPTLQASAQATGCNNASGSISAIASLGSIPYQYSIDGINFQPAPLFSGLPANNYTLTLKDADGCLKSVPVAVGLNNNLTANAGNSITICQGTTKQLSASSNGTSFSWSPSAGLTDPGTLQPGASPNTTTVYTLTATLGICSKTSTATVNVNPAPVADAGRDTTVCFGKSVQLNGSGGPSYQWQPATWLNNTTVPNPVCTQPAAGKWKYALSVTGNNGCKSVKDDTVIITVNPPAKLFAGNDTAVVLSLPLQLLAKDVNNIGFTGYSWSPGYGLDNTKIYNPVATLDRDMTYTVQAATPGGCAGTDTIRIRVYKGPFIYVPGAFTPNRDNVNDYLKVLPVGIKLFRYFSIYNRYGQLVFKTSSPSTGWDGMYKGQQQPMGAYSWMVEGVDYRGIKYFDKGTAVLIR